MNSPRKAGIYTRISNDKEGAGLGVARQAEDCQELAAELGWDVVTVYEDNDISAYQRKRARTGYQQMLVDLESGRTNAVLAWHTDRLHRRNAELEKFIDLIERTGAKVSTVRGGQVDLATPDGRMMARMLGSIAQREVEHGQDRVRRAKEQAAKAGKWRGGPRPFGYETDGLTIREIEAAAVKRAADNLIAGQSLRSIASELTAQGHRTTSTKSLRLDEINLRNILLRPRNAGFSELRGEIIGKAQWPGILTEETWRAAVSILKDPARRTTTGSTPKWLGSNLFLCGVCKTPVRASMSGDRRRVYRCTNGSHVTRTLAAVDEVVNRVIVNVLRQPETAGLLSSETTTDNVGPLREEAAALRARRDQLALDYAEGNLNGQQVKIATGRMDSRILELESQLAEAGRAAGLADLLAAPDTAQFFLEAPLGRRRAVINALATVSLLPQKRGRPKGWSPERTISIPNQSASHPKESRGECTHNPRHLSRRQRPRARDPTLQHSAVLLRR
ncbi:DNA invertase Pin-like site-specific DNA recombinase [Pseudarthrobacter oxydans]|uniref:recombinase family protein n=1 Tax=Pseudarthrobacter oxydans TaxID=1671 RepID=UPI002780EF3C|nr:recombinase family protein [Pseudarthrobacter oxydans]MDP9982938.1 DNA invertase Pin-like site-specific DNA recombinase [Pseudarthrobacter oxydans]